MACSTRRSTEHVRTGTYALKLRYDEPAGVFQGPELKIPVEPGDIIDLEVYTLWEAGPGTKPGAIDFKIINGDGLHYNFIRTTQSSATANVWHRSSIDNFEVMAKPPGVDQLYLIVRPAVYSNEYITWFDDMKLTVRSGSEESSRTADVKSYSDYYAFGMQMPGRYANDGYRYGFNGKERDIVGLGGGGSTYDYGFRIYNPQISRFLSVDPLFKAYPFYTPYQFAGNKPIAFIDLDGLEEAKPEEPGNKGKSKIERSESSTAVITLGLQGGIGIKLFGASLEIEGNLGSIDVIGIRDGEFVFFKNQPRRGGNVALGPLTVFSVEQTTEERDLGDLKSERTTVTTTGYGTSTNTKLTETTEVQIIDHRKQYQDADIIKTKKEVHKEEFGFKISGGIGIEVSKSEEYKIEK